MDMYQSMTDKQNRIVQYFATTDVKQVFNADDNATFIVMTTPNQIICKLNYVNLIDTNLLTDNYAKELLSRAIYQHKAHMQWEQQYNAKRHIVEATRVFEYSNANQASKDQIMQVVKPFETDIELIIKTINRQLQQFVQTI